MPRPEQAAATVSDEVVAAWMAQAATMSAEGLAAATFRGNQAGLATTRAASGAGEPAGDGDPLDRGDGAPRLGESPTQPTLRDGTSDLPLLTLDESPGDAVARTLVDLRLGALLGEGGMGVVHLAEQVALRRDVAVKRARETTRSRESLVAEARVMGALEHPGVVPVHALGIDVDGRPILVMKRIEGTSWGELLADPTHPTWATLEARVAGDRLAANLAILMQVCDAVAFAHERGFLHRDIKPANVFVGRHGEAVLGDWGIALRLSDRETAPRGPTGTPQLMAPEMVTGDPTRLDPRTDVYLLGATLHAALTGKPRHGELTLVEALFEAAVSAPVAYGPEVPLELGELANAATARDPASRPPSAAAFREALAAFERQRGALELCTASTRRIEQAAADATSDDLSLRRKARQGLAEGRFGLDQVAEVIPAHSRLRAARIRHLEIAVELEIADGAPEAARLLLNEAGTAPPALERRVAEAEAIGAKARAETEGLLELARDRDLGVSRGARTGFFVLVAVVAVTTALFMRSVRLSGTRFAEADTPLIPLAIALFLAPAAYLARRDLARNAINRALLTTAVLACVTSSMLRFFGFVARTPVDHVMGYEMLALGALSAALGAGVARAFYLPAVAAVAGAGLALAFPTWLEMFYIPHFLALAAVQRMARSSAAPASRR